MAVRSRFKGGFAAYPGAPSYVLVWVLGSGVLSHMLVGSGCFVAIEGFLELSKESF